MAAWYLRRYDVSFGSETQVLATVGLKKGLTHLALAKRHNISVIHEVVYADIVFDRYSAP